ncbi:S53 family peptidase [Mucilaginibacter sp. McL0603]|uniref:S53 family peptidase n=1 Tax=Mucilaginibacter sp. McL0603 TaxID=3415670 RepID=UPI003CF37849
MAPPKKVAVTGSNKAAHSGETSGKINRDESIEVTVRIRRKKPLEAHVASDLRVSHKTYEKQFGASQSDVDKVETFAHEHHLTTVEASLARRSVILSGSIADMESAFGVSLSGKIDSHGDDIRTREGDIYVPAALKDIVEGVFGLDNRRVARPLFRLAQRDGQIISHAAAPAAFTADQLANIYGFPSGFNGKGQTIAIIELGGGYRAKDIKAYFKSLGIKKPSVKAISVDHGKNTPTNANSADSEVMLDIEVAGAVAPGAKIVVYFCPNTDKGFLDAITKAIHDGTNKPSVISISWGAAEVNWTTQSLNNFNEAFKAASVLGVTICVAAGDNGSSDGMKDGKVHVDFPASSPFVLACGGTSLKANGNLVSSEVVWHDSDNSATGGGVSNFFPMPGYQANAQIPLALDTQFKGRGVPDVAGDADPDTGYKVLVDGQSIVVGGTSAVAPLMAGLIARVNQQKGQWAGFINPTIYAANPSMCRDIIQGDNKTTSSHTGYTAGPGWDPCTGLGVLSNIS